MNSLIITLCILIKSTVIVADTKRLSILESPASINLDKLVIPIEELTFKLVDEHHEIISQPKTVKFLYNYSYNTDTGIQAQEDGYLNNVDTDQEALEAQGSYSYTDNEGNTFQVSYVANENGFQPEGAHLPTIPLLIRKALQYITEHPEKNEKK